MSEAHVYNFTKGVDNMFMFQPMYIEKCFDKKQLYLYQTYSPLLDSLLSLLRSSQVHLGTGVLLRIQCFGAMISQSCVVLVLWGEEGRSTGLAGFNLAELFACPSVSTRNRLYTTLYIVQAWYILLGYRACGGWLSQATIQLHVRQSFHSQVCASRGGRCYSR